MNSILKRRINLNIFKNHNIDSILLILWIFQFIILASEKYLLTRIGIEKGLFRETIIWISTFFPLLIFFFNLKKYKLKKYFSFFVLLNLIIIILMVSLIFNPDLFEFYFKKNYGIDRILRPDSAIFAFLFFQLFDNHKKLLDTLIKISLIYFIFTVVIELIPAIKAGYWTDIGADGNQIKLTYNLSFGYKLTFPTILFIYSFVFQKKKIFLLNSIIGFLLILIYGNRGAILVILIYIFLILLSLFEKYSLPKKILFISSLIVLFLLFMHYLGSIILFFANALERFNIDSRTLKLLAYGRISEDNGRDIIWDTVINAIKQGGIFGYGILGDRPFVSPIHYVGYSHNIFLELVVSFGIFGYLITIYLIIDAIKMIFFCKNEYSKQLYIIFFSVSCQLLLSMSFWFVWEFWAMLAISSSYKRMEKEKNKVRLVDRFERNYKKK